MDQSHPPEYIVKPPPVGLEGVLAIPQRAPSGLIIVAHGSGSSRFSPRNNFVAGELRKAGFSTLLFDLLSLDEESDRYTVFDIELLSRRLEAATQWSEGSAKLCGLRHDYFCASAGAAAALVASTRLRSKRAALATHLFEESGALEQVVDLAADWFRVHLAKQTHG